MIRILSLLLLVLTLTGCRGHMEPKIDSSGASRVILTYSGKLTHEKHLRLDDSVVYYNGYINRIRLDFSTQEVINDLWTARELLVDTVEGLLEKLNEDPEVSYQLRNFPFTADNLEVYITFKSFYGKYLDLNTSALITLRNGIANYFTFTATDCNEECWDQRNEYYWQSKMFTEYHREGDRVHKPKIDPNKTAFKKERYLPPST